MLADYYANPTIRQRMWEFLGGRDAWSASAAYLTTDDFGATPGSIVSVHQLEQCCDRGSDIGRSLWDHLSLIAHLDIEYVNFDFPGEPYLSPGRAFELQQPVIESIQEVLLRYHLSPLHLISGRGHHLVWRVPRSSAEFRELARIGEQDDGCASEQRAKRSFLPAGIAGDVSLDLRRAYVGLGMVMEFVATEALRAAAGRCRIPVELTAVEVGPSERGREIVSIDISEYGDPIQSRGVRIPFSAYLKPRQQREWIGEHVVESLPPMFMIPLFEIDYQRAIHVMRDQDDVVALAARADASIPDQSGPMQQLISDYRASELGRVHRRFYEDRHDRPEDWPTSYDRTPLEALPSCARAPLRNPNDLLLKPAEIQLVTRVLLASGWRPRHIAGLIRSKYERDFGWGERWQRFEASQRADFYARVFASLVELGLDPLIDFNCRSTQEKWICPVQHCSSNLLDWRAALTARMH